MTRATWTTMALVLAAAPGRADEALFKDRVAPILKKRCVECHNPKKSRGGLDLSTRAALLRGGDQGDAVVPGKAEKSLLIEQIAGPKPSMPQQGSPLSTQEI